MPVDPNTYQAIATTTDALRSESATSDHSAGKLVALPADTRMRVSDEFMNPVMGDALIFIDGRTHFQPHRPQRGTVLPSVPW